MCATQINSHLSVTTRTAFSSISFVKIGSDVPASTTITVSELPQNPLGNLTDIRKQAANQAAQKLAELNITVRKGEQIRKVADGPIDENSYANPVRELKFRSRNPLWVSPLDYGHCKLALTEIQTNTTDGWGAMTQKFKIYLSCGSHNFHLPANAASMGKVLFEDGDLPDLRKKALWYELDSVYIYDPGLTTLLLPFDFNNAKILVLVRYYENASPHSRLRYTAVSGNFW